MIDHDTVTRSGPDDQLTPSLGLLPGKDAERLDELTVADDEMAYARRGKRPRRRHATGTLTGQTRMRIRIVLPVVGAPAPQGGSPGVSWAASNETLKRQRPTAGTMPFAQDAPLAPSRVVLEQPGTPPLPPRCSFSLAERYITMHGCTAHG